MLLEESCTVRIMMPHVPVCKDVSKLVAVQGPLCLMMWLVRQLYFFMPV